MLNVATSSRHAVVTAPSLLPPAQLRGRCSLPWSFRTAQSTRRRTGGLPASRRSKLHSMIYMICISTWSESRSLARCIQCASLGTGEECSVTLLLCRTTMHPRRLGHWESSHSAISGSLPTHQTVTAHVFVRVRGSSKLEFHHATEEADIHSRLEYARGSERSGEGAGLRARLT